MTTNKKISPAFEPFLADRKEDGKLDAIVIYKAPPLEGLPLRGRMRELKRRLYEVKDKTITAQVKKQKEVEQNVFQTYQENTRDLGYTEKSLNTATIGAGNLPFSSVEVTNKTLPALAENPNVVAVLPNQKIKLIQPKKIEYQDLFVSEIKDEITWGLQQLEIPQIWETTKGKDINVAVLDTGVYGEHPAFTNSIRKEDFVIIDPLGRRINCDRTFDAGQHGTHVCGTIAGNKTESGVSIGVAPDANLLVGGVLVGDATLLTLFEGITWAIEKGADIINMSLGLAYYEPRFAEVLEIIVSQYGILPVVAIGNENHGNSSTPGNAHNAFSVGAVEKVSENDIDVAFFSSGASLVFPGDTNALVTKPDIVAPGSQVYSSIPPERRQDGTVFQYT